MCVRACVRACMRVCVCVCVEWGSRGGGIKWTDQCIETAFGFIIPSGV